ncbi:hypothetical protein BGZ73_001552 [Actinomortierella ambigua]|nr:hypothetical protein BGZ73_001552 [Actinomortierella ambigua]
MDTEPEDVEEGLVRSTFGGKDEDEEQVPDDSIDAVLGLPVNVQESQKITKGALTKLRGGVVKIRRSQGLFEAFKEHTSAPDKPNGLSPLLDVALGLC